MSELLNSYYGEEKNLKEQQLQENVVLSIGIGQLSTKICFCTELQEFTGMVIYIKNWQVLSIRRTSVFLQKYLLAYLKYTASHLHIFKY